MSYNIINKISSSRVPAWGNKKQFIAIHYLGVVGQSYELAADGCGAHYYIYWDGTIYQRCSHDAVTWAVGTGGYYTKVHPTASNYNTISIEMCCKCDGDARYAEDKRWYFTTETQEACVWLVKKLMKELNIPTKNVLRHRDIVNKTCPAPYVHNNKYKTSWTWDEFKAKLSEESSSSTKSESSEIAYGMKLTEIAKYIMAEFGTASGKNYDCLLGVAQCMKDMTDHGGYGNSLSTVLKNNFTTPSSTYTNECLQAAKDVFVSGKKRFDNAQILQFRSFSKYSDGKGNPDKTKCASLYVKYDYIGADSISSSLGHLYFGKLLSEKSKRTGVINASATIRTGVGTKQPECDFSPLSKGTKVIILGEETASKGAVWYKISHNGKTGFTHSKFVSEATQDAPESIPENNQTSSPSKSKFPYMVKVTASVLNIRKDATVNSKDVGDVRKGECYTIVEEKNGFGKLKSGAGWISLEYTEKI